MAFLGKLFGKKTKAAAKEIKKFENRDLMEGLVGACLLVAYSDGELEDQEVLNMEAQLSANPALEGFGAEINQTVNKFKAMLDAGFLIGKVKIMREVKECSNDQAECEDIFVAALTIAQADGELEPEELKILKEIGSALGVNLRDFDLEA